MRQCIALAGLACLLAGGCAQSGLLGGKCRSTPCHVATSRSAPRPLITRTACPPTCGLCDYEEAACGSAVDECCDPCADGNSCNGRCRGIIDGIASGFCGKCAGVNPHSGGYPEYPTFNQGPPTGQVAYPYYTTRGPRDFLRNNPPTIGPY